VARFEEITDVVKTLTRASRTKVRVLLRDFSSIGDVMKLRSLRIVNFRSIQDSDEVRIESVQALVGENNAGKSNILRAIEVFLTSGAGGVVEEDWKDRSQPIVINAVFGDLQPRERRPPLRKYLLGDKLMIEKHIELVQDKKNPTKRKPEAEYHGYLEKPRDWWLSMEGIEAEAGNRPNWRQIAEEHNLLTYITDAGGGVTKKSYEAGIQRYLEEHPEVEYEEPQLGHTQALGLIPVLLEALPSFHLLPAITDYSDEVDKRATNTGFRKLMAGLSDRILQTDPRFQEVRSAIKQLTYLLNAPRSGEARGENEARLTVLATVEDKIRVLVSKMMPGIASVRLDVTVDEVKEVFSRGVSVWVDDGTDTEVLRKGHGMQRCVVFAFLQALVMNQRGQLVVGGGEQRAGERQEQTDSIILAIEEPELYIHPQLKRTVFAVLKEFAQTDQVIYSTHDPAFVDLTAYHQVGVVRKVSATVGTKVTQCQEGVLGDAEERRGFQFMNSFGVEQNEMFFAKKVILVEGEEDRVGILATGRHLGIFKEFPEEKGYSIIVASNKEEIPKFMRVLNAFRIPYIVLHELDNAPDSETNMTIRNLLAGNRSVELPGRVEDAAGHAGHFNKTYSAKMFFKNQDSVQQAFKTAVAQLFN
jgi:CRISPR-associated exonuclease Cas4